MISAGKVFVAAIVAFADAGCRDTADPNHCPEWSVNGECESNRDFMSVHCRLSCKLCEGITADKILKDIDKDNSGTISSGEFEARLQHVHDLREKQYSTDDEGSMGSTELPSPDDEGEKTDFAQLDANKDGLISADEAQTLMMGDGTTGANVDEEDEFMKDAFEYDKLQFKHADRDHDGRLSPQEFVYFRHEDNTKKPEFVELQRGLMKNDAARQFKQYDTDANGALEAHELESMVEQVVDVTHPDDLKDEL